MPADKRYVRKGPCATCPFNRNVTPGGTGGTDPATYVGQAVGPFLLPCHEVPGYDQHNLTADATQCGGAAVFRANVGVASLLPPTLHRLPPDVKKVFASHAELIAHHRGVSLEEAQWFLEENPPTRLLREELEKLRTSSKARFFAVPKPPT